MRIFATTVLLASTIALPTDRQSPSYDIILRGGAIVDGTGGPRYMADLGIVGSRIARIGDLTGANATVDLDVRGLMVAPGFINVHSHASPPALPVAANMLTQGVTTELLNADGGGPIDVVTQLETLQRAGLALNVVASIGFNAIWSSVVGPSNRRPTAEEIERMRSLVQSNLERGAFGVSAGLDYKPAYFATTDEVVRILEPAKRWRTFFINHDRSTPETGYSSRAGIEETIAIGTRAGLVPVVTHMKIQGREQGTADQVLAVMSRSAAAGHWVAADVYPYLAGQTGLAALIIPGWAQDGGLDSMRTRFRDPGLRARIVKEADEAIAARFNGPDAIMVTGNRRLSDIMRDVAAPTPGAAVVKVLETESPWAILGFGAEPDLVKILQYPDAAVACDCGAATGTRGHPRYYGTFPRVLGRYVRETRALGWEDAVRKMSGLPAAMLGLVDRGLLAPGMSADIAAFDSATVIDHATFERPDAASEGIRHVLVNGKLALRDGKPTGERGGRALRRSPSMPSRPLALGESRGLLAKGPIESADPGAPGAVEISLEQRSDDRRASGQLRMTGGPGGAPIEATALGTLQAASGWASVTGMARVGGGGPERAFVLTVEEADPSVPGASSTVRLHLEGMEPISGRLQAAASVRSGGYSTSRSPRPPGAAGVP